MKHLTHENNQNLKPTEGVYGKSFQYHGITLNVYDLGGQKAFREYWKYYYENIDALIFLLMEVMKKEFQNVTNHSKNY